jgi:phosphinothricin acetyltransferase
MQTTDIGLQITPMQSADWEAVRRIYEEGIRTGNATMETTPPGWEKWHAEHLEAGRLVARQGDAMLGWAALTPVLGRCTFAGVAELRRVRRAGAPGRGVGEALLRALVEAAEKAGLWTLQAGILRENAASISLHKKAGFREVGYRERIGKFNGVWRDVVLLERRSPVVGVA